MSNTVFTDVKDITIKGKDVRSIHNAFTGRLIWGEGSDWNEPLKFTNNSNEEKYILVTNYGGNSPLLQIAKNGLYWIDWDYEAISLQPGEYLYVRGDNPTGFSSSASIYTTLHAGEGVLVTGNIMSLLGKTVKEIPCPFCFNQLFNSCDSDFDVSLPATVLKPWCYRALFIYCDNLTKAPTLPASILEKSCYYMMFYGCTSLATAPDLNSPILVDSCYVGIFGKCSSLNYIKCLAENPEKLYMSGWAVDASSTGTFIKKSGVNWPLGNHGIPTSDGTPEGVPWTVVEV